VTLITSSFDIKHFPDTNNKNPIRKKPVRAGDVMFLGIPDSIVEELHIDEQRTFEVIPTREGIFLRILPEGI
jgi:hypothetical protein